MISWKDAWARRRYDSAGETGKQNEKPKRIFTPNQSEAPPQSLLNKAPWLKQSPESIIKSTETTQDLAKDLQAFKKIYYLERR